MSEGLSEQTAESLVQTARQELQALGPVLGNMRGLAEFSTHLEEQARLLREVIAQREAVRGEVKALVEYQSAVRSFNAAQEQRARELATCNTEEERRLQGRLSALEQRLSLLEERQRQAERITQDKVDNVAAWLRQVRGA
jgi:hypothetical protein